MRERIFKLFLYIDGEERVIHEVGAVFYHKDGSDAEKVSFLQSRVEADYKRATRFPLTGCKLVRGITTTDGQLTYDSYAKMCELGMAYLPFEGLFRQLGAPQEPIQVITCIVDGKPTIEAVAAFVEGKTCPVPE